MSLQKFLILQDKANHFVYGALWALIGVLVASPTAGMLFCLFWAVAREMSGPTSPDLRDVLWTLAGGAAVCLPGFVA